ncbi:MAG: putative porin [Phycisphaerae bacterium]|nr:putative porin [Phycisphaerae bacterium]
MTKKVFWMIGVTFLAGVLAGDLRADEISELKEQIARQNESLQAMQEKLSKIEASHGKNNQILARQISELSALKPTEPQESQGTNWYDALKFSGDFRYRHESIEAENDGKPDRHRNRFRARLGLKAKINDDLDLGFRFATGSEDPVSTNQTLAGSFSSKGFWVDKAYLDYHPIDGFNVLAGKMGNPFVKVGKNQLIWDGDLTLEGVGGQYKTSLGDMTELFANGGGFMVTESSSSDSDMTLWGVQGGIKQKLGSETSLTGGVSYYNYGNIQAASDLDVGGTSFFGNSSSSGVFVNDYDLVELFGELSTQATPVPMGLYGNYVVNTAADTSGDTGWLVGGKINKASKPGSWELSYDYRELQKDVVVGAFSDSDFIGGGTNGRGSRFGGKYQIAKNVQAGLTYFLNKRNDTDDDYRRLQADIVVKF